MPLIIWGFILPIFTIPMIMPHCPYSRLCSLLSSLLYLYMYPRLFLKYTKFKNFLLLMVLKNYFHMNMKLLFPKYFFCLKFVLPKYQMTGAFNILFHWYDPKFEILPLEVSRGALLVFNYLNRLLFFGAALPRSSI